MSPLWERIKKVNLVKKLVYALVGSVSYPGLNIFNKLEITGTEHFSDLPRENVLFVSNHQTYFADVICFLHIFGAVKWGKKNKLGFPVYLFNPYTRVYFVAAEETMKANWMTRLFALAGAL
ncbi:MAG: 1-acyl-sn-glycerol-3-phosphate acyltransferase, partial [Chitinophagaceae bacterium]